MDPDPRTPSQRFRPFTGKAWRLADTHPIEDCAHTIVDGATTEERDGEEDSDETLMMAPAASRGRNLEEMKCIISALVLQVPSHLYTDQLKAATDDFVVQVTKISASSYVCAHVLDEMATEFTMLKTILEMAKANHDPELLDNTEDDDMGPGVDHDHRGWEDLFLPPSNQDDEDDQQLMGKMSKGKGKEKQPRMTVGSGKKKAKARPRTSQSSKRAFLATRGNKKQSSTRGNKKQRK